MRVFGIRQPEVADIPFYHLMYLNALHSTSHEGSICFFRTKSPEVVSIYVYCRKKTSSKSNIKKLDKIINKLTKGICKTSKKHSQHPHPLIQWRLWYQHNLTITKLPQQRWTTTPPSPKQPWHLGVIPRPHQTYHNQVRKFFKPSQTKIPSIC